MEQELRRARSLGNRGTRPVGARRRTWRWTQHGLRWPWARAVPGRPRR